MSFRDHSLILAVGMMPSGDWVLRVQFTGQGAHPAVTLRDEGADRIRVRVIAFKRSQVTEAIVMLMSRHATTFSLWLQKVVREATTLLDELTNDGTEGEWPDVDDRLLVRIRDVPWQRTANVRGRYLNDFNGLEWLWEVVQLTEQDLADRGFGPHRINQVKAVLARDGLELGTVLTAAQIEAYAAHAQAIDLGEGREAS